MSIQMIWENGHRKYNTVVKKPKPKPATCSDDFSSHIWDVAPPVGYEWTRYLCSRCEAEWYELREDYG